MSPDVQPSVDARVTFFDQYFEVPESLKAQVDALMEKIKALGENSSDAASFEEAFIHSGLSDEFNSLIPKCVPKKGNLSTEWKAESKAIRKEMMKDMAKDAAVSEAEYAALSAKLHVKETIRTERRKEMIANDVFDDYTRASNKIHEAKRLGGLLGGLFKKET